MQLRKMTLLFATLGAMSMMLTGCPEEAPTLTCSADTDCLESEICHPNAKVCVQTCTSGADCPDTAKTCEALDTANASSQKICKCSTTALCNTGRETADLVCLTETYKVCAPKCSTDTDCAAGQTCDTASGVCKGGTTPGQTCSGVAQSTCAYGQFCSASKCTVAPVAPTTCENFAQNRPQWSATSSNGPVIYDVSLVSYQTAYQYCDQSQGQRDAFIVRVKAYRTDADWPSTRSGLSGFFYVTTQSAQTDIVNSGLLVPNTGYNRNTSNLKDAEFNVYLCRPANSTTIQPGFFFTGGNPVCANLSR